MARDPGVRSAVVKLSLAKKAVTRMGVPGVENVVSHFAKIHITR